MSDDLVELFKLQNITISASVNDEEQGGNNGPKIHGSQEKDENTINYNDIMREEYEVNDTRIAMIGNVDSGKSTLIGQLWRWTISLCSPLLRCAHERRS
jgi:polynucleotide 5'-kinase involved in rRNA processing